MLYYDLQKYVFLPKFLIPDYMTMKVRNFSFLIFILFLLACQRNPLNVNIRNIDLEIKIERFEKELFTMETDTLAEGISYLSDKYRDFFDIFSFHVINIGMPADDAFAGYLAMFLTDGLNREVYNEAMKVFPGLNDLEATLTNAFKRYIHYFPGRDIPEIVTYISRFNHSYFTVENYIGIGLDKYLGSDSPYYASLGLPLYQRQNMFREKIPSDVLYAFAAMEIPYNDETDNLLNSIIHQGKIMYFVDALLPDQPDGLKIGYTSDQLKWCKNNERQMWEYLIEHKLIFSSDKMVLQKLTGPAPFSYFFTSESPGRTGIWIGWQIVRKFVNNNKELSLEEILNETDYQKILRESRYNP